MVTPECLAALDHLLWLQTGQRAAEALSCDQSTISRTSRKALATFELQLKRQQGSWQLSGDHTLLNLERRVHQQLRWSTGGRLRLDGHPACRAASRQLLLPDWTIGPFQPPERNDPLLWLQQGLIDAWLCPPAQAAIQLGLAILPLTPTGPALILPQRFSEHPRSQALRAQLMDHLTDAPAPQALAYVV